MSITEAYVKSGKEGEVYTDVIGHQSHQKEFINKASMGAGSTGLIVFYISSKEKQVEIRKQQQATLGFPLQSSG